ncbi:MAG: EAL domain-containing protein [Thermaerobacter sp.]|nr:EAL domain-containing protein [Thermaerobacter sp.]
MNLRRGPRLEKVTGFYGFSRTISPNELSRMLLKHLPAAIFLKDGQGRWQMLNRAAMQLVELDETKPWWGRTDLELADMYPQTRATFEVCAASDERAWHAMRESHGFERVVDADGREHNLSIRKIPFFRPDGTRKALLVIATDGRSPQQSEECLQRRQQELETIIDATSSAIWYKDRNHRFLRVNRAACALIGRRYDEIVGHLDEEIFPSNVEQYREFENYVMDSQRSTWDSIEKLVLATGEAIDVEVDRVPYLAGAEVIGVIVFARDVTHRVKTETALRASEERYRNILAEIKDGYFEVDISGNLTFFNPALCDILGYPADEMYGLNDRQYTDHQNAQELYQAFNRVYRTGIPFAAEWQIIRKDGERRYLDASVSLMRDDDNRPIGFRGIARDITERKNSELQLHFLAHHDRLTNLPNRSRVVEQLEMALQFARRRRQVLAVLFIDLDRFKNVNDTLGHAAGDQLLQGVAKRLQEDVRDGDMVARMGGDEFIVLLSSVSQVDDVRHVANRILQRLREPWELDGEEFRCPGSIGIALYPDDGEDPGTLLKHADIAMYRAKDAGGNGYVLYNAGMNLRANEYVVLETGLHQALQRHEFVVHYQPQVDSRSGRLNGVEALVRWDRPGVGLVLPRDFITFSEETGLIVPIGEQVLRQACAQAAVWLTEGSLIPRVAVNLSARQFQQHNIVEVITKALEDTGLPADRLEIEITESAAMQNVSYTMHLLNALRSLGIAVSLDDFGTGFSSLSYLKDFPITALKIDQSFIGDVLRDRKDLAIVKTVIELARNLGLNIIAEGVESKEQMIRLQELGCYTMQGYYFSHPLPADQFGVEHHQRSWNASPAR